MNPCQRIESLMSFYVDDECSPAERKLVDGHVVTCPRCRAQMSDLTRLMRRVKLLPVSTVSEGFTGRVLDEALGRPAAGLEEPVVPLPRSALRTWVPAVTAAAALLAVAWVGLRGPRTEVPHAGRRPVAGEPGGGIHMAERVPVVSEEIPVSGALVVDVLTDLDPALEATGNPAPVSLGTRYVLEDWILREPAGGGDPVLTRVAAPARDRVTVSF